MEKYVMTGRDSTGELQWERRNASKGLEPSLNKNIKTLRIYVGCCISTT